MTPTDKALRTISQVKKSIPPRNRLAALRMDSGLTVRDMATYSGVSPATISRVEAGKPPDIRTALKLARFFETSVEDLFHEFTK